MCFLGSFRHVPCLSYSLYRFKSSSEVDLSCEWLNWVYCLVYSA